MLRNTMNLLGLVAALLLAGTTAQGSLIGFNFSGGWQSGPFNLAASDTAGVVPQQNWNNWMGAGGQTNWNYTNIALVDNTGAATTAKAQIGPYFGQNDGPGPGNNTGGIQTLYGGKTREGNGGNWTATFTAIPYLKYDVYAYAAGYGGTETIAVSGATTGNGSKSMTYGGSIASYVQGSNYQVWSGVSGTSFTIASTSGNYAVAHGFQIVQASKPIISIADADWATGSTWDLAVSPNTATDYDVTVQNTVTFSEAAQVVSSLTLAAVDGNATTPAMTIPVGAGLTGGTDVQLGTLTVNGGLTASTLKVSGGSATLAAGSTGAIGALNVTTGTATVAAGSAATIGSVGASGGITNLGRNAGTLAVSGTGTVNTTAAVTVPIVTVAGTGSLDTTGGALSATTVGVSGGAAILQGGTIGTVNASGGTTTLATNVGALKLTGTALVLGGGGGGAGTAILKTGSTLNTQTNYLAVGTSIKLNDSTLIAVSGGTFDVKGADVGAKTISDIRLNGGTVTISGPPAAAVFGSSQYSGWLTGSSNSYAGVNFTPGANGMLIAMVGGEGSPSITSVSWTPTGGSIVAMTEAVKANAGNVLSGIWYMPSPALGTGSGTGTLSYVLSGNPSRAMIGSVYATGVDQTVMPASASVSGNFPQTAGPIAAALGSLVVSSGTNGSATVSGGIVSGGDTSLWNVTGSTGVGASYKISTGGTESGKWNTPTSTGIANIASFGSAGAAPFSFDLPSTNIELAADTTLDLGLATSSSFFDVFLEVGLTGPKTLRLQGANFSVVSGLASFFDVTAPNNALITLGETNGTTYQDVVVMPEPATMAFVVLGGLGILARRRRGA